MLRPIGNRVVVKEDDYSEENVSDGGIITDIAKTKKEGEVTSRGTILTIGSEVKDVAVGDSIFYETHGGHKVTIKGQKFILLAVNNILGVDE